MLEVAQLSHRFAGQEVLSDIGLEVAEGECLAILGPSGCGKTTLLRLIAGLLPQQSGRIRVAGRPPAPGRGCTMMFQTPRLLPWRRARANIEMGLQHLGRAERQRRAEALLQRLGLEEAGRLWPQEMSGGMQQRLGLARALALDVPLLLLDEPFANLDPLAREQMQEELITQTSGKGVVLVTHSVDEALALGHRILLLNARPGRVARRFEFDTPARGLQRRSQPDYYERLAELTDHLRQLAIPPSAASLHRKS